MNQGDGASHIELGVASRTAPGQEVSGDLHTYLHIQAGVLIAVVDGLGHGAEAAMASQAAVKAIACTAGESVISVLERCHEQLKSTRGVVMGLAEINSRDDTITWLAVGNVMGFLLRADPLATPPYETILQRRGVIGYRLPMLQASVHTLGHGDTLILATDGISNGFEQEFIPDCHAQDLADRISDRYTRDNDDALVLVAKYLKN